MVKKANPTSTPAPTSHLPLARSLARRVAYAAAVSRKTSKASGLLKRNISAATGVRANRAPASSPAACPELRRTDAYSTPTVATPSSACGARMLHELSPKMRTEKAISHSEAGGLSTVMALPASREPKRKAFQLCEPACAAAE